MKVIGTAGHIDHGKSSLVHRLTGIDPDRLAEEKRRGMTIDLGFAWLILPSGTEASIVDVPGHERFIKNMLAGAGGIDLALLVIAADEGVMPQTREHLDILDLLGVRTGVVALTKSDLVDEEWLELVRDEVATLLEGTTLQGSPLVAVSSVTGSGIDTLLMQLDSVIRSQPDRPDRGQPFLPIDRVFTIAGFGAVVTGTLSDGRLSVGQEVEILPRGKRARIRGIESHRSKAESVDPGARAAINLAGVTREEIARGDVLVLPNTLEPISRFDALVNVVKSAPFPLEHGMQATVHIGAAERGAAIAVLGAEELAAGAEGWVQVRLREPVAAQRGQRFIIRLPAPGRTIAGGEIIDVVPRHRRLDSAATARLQSLATGSPSERLLASFGAGGARSLLELITTSGLSAEDAQREVTELQSTGELLALGGFYMSKPAWNRIEDAATRLLTEYHAQHPLRKGMPREELRSRMRIGADLWPPAIERLARDGVLRDEGSHIALTSHRGGVQSRQSEANRVLDVLSANPYAPPSGNDLIRATGADTSLIEALTQDGSIVRIADGLYFSRGAYDRIVCEIVALIRDGQEVTVASLRDAFGTSRKYAVALLEHLDAERITRRIGDTRTLGSRVPACV